MAEDTEKTQASLVYMLSEMNRGEDLRSADQAFQELLEGLKQYGGKGSLTLTVKLEFLKPLDNGVDQIQAATDVKITKPKGKRAASVFFADDRCTMSRDDPNQLRLFAERERESGKVRSMKEATTNA